MGESFAEEVERRREERETQPEECSHCGFETADLTNYSRTYGGNVGAHWLCKFCEVTLSASRLGAGGRPDDTVRDIASMLHVLARTRPVADSAGQPTADLRGLAAEALRKHDVGLRFAPESAVGGLADAVIAAVLPAHRAAVLAEAAEAIEANRDSRGNWLPPAALLRRLAATGPTTGPASTSPAQDALVVPEEPDGHSGAQGDARPSAGCDDCDEGCDERCDCPGCTAPRQGARVWHAAHRTAVDCGHDLEAYADQQAALDRVRALATNHEPCDSCGRGGVDPAELLAALDGTEEG